MAKAHMTKLGWFETEVDKLINLGHPNGEALQIILDRLATMNNIEWWDGNPTHDENKHDDKEVWAWWY